MSDSLRQRRELRANCCFDSALRFTYSVNSCPINSCLKSLFFPGQQGNPPIRGQLDAETFVWSAAQRTADANKLLQPFISSKRAGEYWEVKTIARWCMYDYRRACTNGKETWMSFAGHTTNHVRAVYYGIVTNSNSSVQSSVHHCFINYMVCYLPARVHHHPCKRAAYHTPRITVSGYTIEAVLCANKKCPEQYAQLLYRHIAM